MSVGWVCVSSENHGLGILEVVLISVVTFWNNGGKTGHKCF